MSEKGSYPREAALGEIVHDRGSEPESGWFIVGEGGYFDVDNACWCEPNEDDAPWTTEWFDLLGTIHDLIAEGPEAAVRYAQAQTARMTTDHPHPPTETESQEL